jgi:serine/threonine-protein kinase HipA
VVERDGSLWIAKFPAHADTRDVAAWEMLGHTLARRAGIVVADARLAQTGRGYRTFCTRRFDRTLARQDARPTRVFYASALTMTGRTQSEGASYLDLAWFLTAHGDPDQLRGDLEQQFRRVLFNVVVGNRDDHLRNHGFILSRGGWRPAPAFDINPDPDRAEHVLALDDRDPRPNVATVLATAELYRLAPARARTFADDIQRVASGWRPLARRLRIPAADIATMAGAFAV